MKLFVGNPLNSLEFTDLDILISTSDWSLNDQSEVVAILNKYSVECYINKNKIVLDKDNRFITEKNFLLSFGYTNDAMNFEFYFLNLLYQTDLIILSLNFSESLTDRVLSHIHSNLRQVKIPALIVNRIKNEPKVSYIVPNYKNDYEVKDALYFYLDIKKKDNSFYYFGKYLSDLRETVKTLEVKVLR
jgi:hypothetical protein